MSRRQRSYLNNVNRVFIFSLSIAGLLLDGYQTADLLCTFALAVWLWLPLCIKIEAIALKHIQYNARAKKDRTYAVNVEPEISFTDNAIRAGHTPNSKNRFSTN